MGGEFLAFLSENIQEFFTYTGFANFEMGNLIMILCGILFIYLAIAKEFEPMLLIPIGFGILIGNIPFKDAGLQVGIYEEGSVLNILYQGVVQGWYPPLIFLGIGAMTDFSALISNPKLMLIGAAAQFGIFGAYAIALMMGFEPNQAGAIGIIGGADGPTAIFLSSKLAPNLMGAIAISAYSYMALVPVIQPPIIKALTSKKERQIKMVESRVVSRREKIIFPIAVMVIVIILIPSCAALIGMLMLGNLIKESGVVPNLVDASAKTLLYVITIILGLAVGATAMLTELSQALNFGLILVLGMIAFSFATAGGVLVGKVMCKLSKGKINPMIGAAGVSAVPMAARVVHKIGLEEDKSNYLLMHAMGPNVAGVIGSAIAAGLLLSIFG